MSRDRLAAAALAFRSSPRSVTRVSVSGTRFYDVPTSSGVIERYPSVTSVLSIVPKPALERWKQRIALEGLYSELEAARTTPWSTQLQQDSIARALSLPDQVAGTAAEFGTSVHHLIDARIAGKLPALPDSSLKPEPEPEPGSQDTVLGGLTSESEAKFAVALRNFELWERACGYEFLCGDFYIWSEKYKYAGAADALAYTRGDRHGNGAGFVVIDFKTSNAIQPAYALQAAAYARAVEECFGEPVVKAVVVRIGKTRERDVEEACVADLQASFGIFHALLISHAHLQREDAPTLFSARVRLGEDETEL